MFKYYYPIQGIDYNSNIPGNHSHSPGDSVDISIGKYTPIYAIADGVVIDATFADINDDNSSMYSPYVNDTGNRVVYRITSICEIKDTFITCMHLSYPTSQYPQRVYSGSIIKKGQLIGYVGSSGSSTGYHLHIQIRKDYWWSKNYVSWNYNLQNPQYRVSPSYKLNYHQYTQQLIRYLMPQYLEDEPTLEENNIRILGTCAIKEAQSLGLIGMEEVIAVIYNRMKSISFAGTTAYEIVSADNQFSVYYENKTLFDSGGYTIDQLNSTNAGLVPFIQGILSGTISITNSNGWAAGYNSKIALAFYFRSDVLVQKDYLYTRQSGVFKHHYNGIGMWS